MPQPSVLDQKLRLSVNRALINKNEAGNESLFKQGWENVELTPRELADEVDQGHAYACQLSGTRSAANFVRSDILSVDIDQDLSISEAKKLPFAQQHLTILYTTPSHSESRHRFRLIFALPRSIETPQEMRAALRSLALRFGGDRSATDPARLFYGSRGSNPQVFERAITADVLDELIAQGLEADQRESPKSGRTTTVSKQRISPDRIITLEDGRTQLFRELEPKTRICCPFHYDRNASAFVTTSQAGVNGIHCMTCRQSFWPPSATQFDDFSDFDERVKEAEHYFAGNVDIGPFQKLLTGVIHHPGLAHSRIYRTEGQFLKLPEKLPEGLVFIKSPKGTGKTAELARAMQQRTAAKEASSHDLLDLLDDGPDTPDSRLRTHRGSTLLIGHRIALIRQTCSRLGLECYLDFEGPLTSKALGVCLDSLERLTWTEQVSTYKSESRENLFETVVIDESEQVLSHFLSPLIDNSSRNAIFMIFCRLLRRAKRIITLDADLGWLTFETITKLAQRMDDSTRKPSSLYLNERKIGSKLQVFASKDHLIGDLKQMVNDGKRVFVTSNSMGQIDRLHQGLMEQATDELRCIRITSETVKADEAKAFVADPPAEALKYDVILTSPSLGTGVDITFPEQAELIDVVYGIFETGITTHFDMDQQLWRVRHPGEVKVWISPRTASFDTSADVVRREIQQKQLFKSVLSDYDDNLRPEYHTNDEFIDMAVLATSQQRMSKNNLKRNFLAMKRQHGHAIEFIDRDQTAAGYGRDLNEIGKRLADRQYREKLKAALRLTEEQATEIDERIKARDDVTESEHAAYDRYRMERFYREPITDKMIDDDNRGRLRQQVMRFEQLSDHQSLRDARILDQGSEYALKLRFVTDWRSSGALLAELLTLAGVYADGRFLANVAYDRLSLVSMMRRAIKLKPIIEGQLGVEVRMDDSRGCDQLRELLKLVGLDQLAAGKTKAKAVAGGKTIYRYQLDEIALNRMQAIADHRASQSARSMMR
ncbi:plasmid replication protein, CyRepA1 family [Tardiphaga sp.]|uniref:plasmid replication protein, CyRepA1 family n=1 Tax=Tardiphaga sp. TaxID=1926292 RepID=UPI0037DA4530